jgi:CRISPR-associated protein Csb1
MPLSLEQLQTLCRDAAAIRRSARLQPAGGAGDKVYPPTYEGGQYATDTRVIDGARVDCVLLDSVQSQANRMELALLAAHRAGKIAIPVVSVDFAPELPEVGTITSLEAPHRLADAILRDSLLDGKPFRRSAVGQVLDTASTNQATGLLGVCPTALLFGLWDSSGPRGGLGTKFARALVSEVIAVDAAAGVRPASRIDPLGIQKNAAVLYVTKDGQGWTLDEKQAKQEKGKPVRVGKEGKPSEINHGNVLPSLKSEKGGPNHGGVTFSHARQVAVLSLPALRRLRFPDDRGTVTAPRDEAGHAVLAALGLCAISLAVAQGLDLRSRCLLVPDAGHPSSFEAIGADGSVTTFALNAAEACALLAAAVEAARKAGLPWQVEGVRLKPSADFIALVKSSRELATRESAED